MRNSGASSTICRPATRADMSACADILNRWIDATPWMPRIHQHADVERYYLETVFPERTVIVAERNDRVAGFMALSSDHYVTALYVDDVHRGVGVGSNLLKTARSLSATELNLWTFEANGNAQRFYERQGFSAVSRTDGDNEEGLPDILYHWRGAGVRP
ncbi:GNAT family N-acetyltransferase [Ensifer sp. T173]|uniref:GNAT family N-acetyltransferase n=2 Tax=Sinorhizobium/Ensifer group TaxID=227292 RepID=A0AAW4FLM4_9HYPH|nr:GCN5 family acetyltransferase [Ensifer sp. Root31]KQW60198.1 GCN5 family acetyltransferase [Ensifer sp. Root1252]KQW70212.1 GCN5 family acetyltransferase [Ensifer sp. Root127]KQY73452.1 GCN5 family acetyltransferase [Ensifer sp. Root142]KRC75963.1 GCN5 family acetyltransferase [Ensifer sp. Root231]KRC97282.1 GCN5 family acetyltransferase [Ensifer sp. Root258]MBD9490966.1 GNAT family N-acetyltransferase [Ensifer sp. ENS11]MBM3091522.1 GNAT family N-acetyltransferase [Ensifer canadensis]PS